MATEAIVYEEACDLLDWQVLERSPPILGVVELWMRSEINLMVVQNVAQPMKVLGV
jgi:hypothetical protein